MCKKLVTICFVHHFHSFKVAYSEPAEFCICKPSSLYDHYVLYHYEVDGSLFVTLKYYLVEKF